MTMNNKHHRQRNATIQATVLMPMRHTSRIHSRSKFAQTGMSSAEQQESTHQTSASNNPTQWKKVIAGMLLAAILLPLVGWFALAILGNVWIDTKQLNTFYTQVQEASHLPNGQPVVRTIDMPSYVADTLLAIEDHRYYLHPGVDPVGIARSIWVDLVKGKKAQGGSTVTMQLARNMFLTHEKTYIRKIKEIAISANLELRYTKQELADMYMNKVYFGHGKYGIESAARFYFGKTTMRNGELPTINLAETAVLVGLLKAPEHYSPYKNKELAERRQSTVLNRMNTLGWITDTELEQALNTPLVYAQHTVNQSKAA